LHLEIVDTPSSIKVFFLNTLSHIKTLIQEIDKAIAAAKGLEISEDQLTEFRETFSHFDKDKTNALEYFELLACLTAMGENSTEEECKGYIAKYSTSPKMDFDSYVKFMLDYFSKAETAESGKEAFKALSQNSPVVTEEILSRYFTPEDTQYMISQMDKVEGGYDFGSWLDKIYE